MQWVRLKLWLVRLLVVASTMAGVLIPAWASPSRVISVPRTSASAMEFPGRHLATFVSGLQHFSFSPTHIAFVWTGDNGTGIRYRSVSGAGASRWREAPEAVDLQHASVHYSGVLSVEGVRAVQWRAIVPKGAAMGAVTLDYMNTLDGPRVTEKIPAVAEALADTPHIVTRAEWGADESIKRATGGCTRHFYPVQQLFVHHTAGTNNDPHPRATMRAIYYFHTKIRGWCDIGYNFVIGPDGTVYEGRWARNYSPWEVHTSETRSGRAVMGAHVQNFNGGSVGISMMGNYSLIRLPAAMRPSLAKLLAWESDRHHLRPLHRHTYESPTSRVSRMLPYIAGHRDAGSTACPGNYLYAALPGIRNDTVAVIGAGKRDSFISLDVSSELVRFHRSVKVSGSLTRRSGAGIGGAPVLIYTRRPPRAWHETAVTTADDGGFSFQTAPRSRMKVRAVYNGGRRTWGSQSRQRRIYVEPRVNLHPVDGTPDPDGIVHYPAGTTVVDFMGSVRPDHPGLNIRVRVSKYASDGSAVRLVSDHPVLDPSSDFDLAFAVPAPGPGLYKAVAKFFSDGDHATARSGRILFMVDP